MTKHLSKITSILLSMSLMSCAGSSAASMNQKSDTTGQAASEIESVTELMPECVLGQKEYELPVSLQTFLDDGWTIRMNALNEEINTVNYMDPSETELPPCEFIEVQLRTGSNLITAEVCNTSCIRKPVTECNVVELTAVMSLYVDDFEACGISRGTAPSEIRKQFSSMPGYEESAETITVKKSEHESVISISLADNEISSVTVSSLNPWMLSVYEPQADLEKEEEACRSAAAEYSFEEEIDAEAVYHLQGTVSGIEDSDEGVIAVCEDASGNTFGFIIRNAYDYAIDEYPVFNEGDEAEIYAELIAEHTGEYPLFRVYYAYRNNEAAMQFRYQ